MSFDAVAEKYDRWYESPEGRYIDSQENGLFLKLVKPQPGQSILEVGCGTGHNVLFFEQLGLKVSGVEPSKGMLEVATKRCSPDMYLCPGEAGRLEFQDGSFDIVVIITALEFMKDPLSALREAFRTSRGVVYLGVLNKLSILGINRRIRAVITRKGVYCEARFYTIRELKKMIREVAPEASIEWGSVLFLPFGLHRYFKWLDTLLSSGKHPFGGFLGVKATKAGAA